MSSSTVPALPALNVTVSLLSPEQGWPRGLCLLDLNVLGELSPKTVVKNSNPAQKCSQGAGQVIGTRGDVEDKRHPLPA